jgi:hypothetical protein
MLQTWAEVSEIWREISKDDLSVFTRVTNDVAFEGSKDRKVVLDPVTGGHLIDIPWSLVARSTVFQADKDEDVSRLLVSVCGFLIRTPTGMSGVVP